MKTPNDKCWLKHYCNQKDCNNDFCIKLYKLNYLYEQALIPLNNRKHIDFILDDKETDKKAYDRLKEIENDIDNFIKEGNNLYIYSRNCGNSKTSWSLRLVEVYFNKIWLKTPLKCRALFIHVPTFLLSLKDNITERNNYIDHIKKNILECDVVVWDEIGTKNATPYEMENLLSIINSRLNEGKANIYTSNLNGEELQDKMGERLYSRIINASENIEFFGADKRGILS
jgi:DNA replication protein DnaC